MPSTITLIAVLSTALPADVTLSESDGQILGAIDGQHVFSYHMTTVGPAGAKDDAYARSGFVHPLKTLSGVTVTDDFPPDHLHQNGLFATWVNVTFEGHRTDFWNNGKNKGTFRHTKLLGMQSGDEAAEFVVEIEHVDETSPNGAKVALIEKRSYRLSTIGSYVVVDVHGIQKCATDSPVIINEYHYGGPALRGARHWSPSDRVDFVNEQGENRIDGNHTKTKWFQLFGPATSESDTTASVTLITHPQNFRYPEPARLHPKMPYGVFSPCVEGEFRIEPGKPLAMRYRYVAADGKPGAAELKSVITTP